MIAPIVRYIAIQAGKVSIKITAAAIVAIGTAIATIWGVSKAKGKLKNK